MNDALISIISPVFNEQESLLEFYSRLSKVLKDLGMRYEIIFVDDGSSDNSSEILAGLKRKDLSVRVLTFSRNFGHQIAVKAGLDHAQGDGVVIIDTDLQDPPEFIPALTQKWKEGYDVVYAVRAERSGEGFFKKCTASLYYSLIRRIASVSIPVNTGDFRLISSEVVAVLRGIREQSPYLRGLISWVGFRQIGIPMNREARFAGKTKYPLRKMLSLAWSGITHFSFFPLRLAGIVGSVLLAVSAVWLGRIFYIQAAFSGGEPLAALILFVSGIQLLSIAILGQYLAFNYDQSRARPLYILKKSND